MPTGEKDQNNRAKEHDQNPSFFFYQLQNHYSRVQFFYCLVLFSSGPGNEQKTCIWWDKMLLIIKKRERDRNQQENKERRKVRTETKKQEKR